MSPSEKKREEEEEEEKKLWSGCDVQPGETTVQTAADLVSSMHLLSAVAFSRWVSVMAL